MSTNSSCLPVIPNQPAHLRSMGQLAADAFSDGQSENREFTWDAPLKETNKIMPLCP